MPSMATPSRLGVVCGVHTMARSDLRFRVGATVLVASFCAPAFIPLVAASDLPTAGKTALSGLLAAGIPEVGMLAAVAIMGRDGIDRIKTVVGRRLAPLAPPDRVGPTRYRVGLVLFCCPLLLGWLAPYLGSYLPGYATHSLIYAIGGDAMLLVSLFVLGGEFWDKLHALFKQDVRLATASAGKVGI